MQLYLILTAAYMLSVHVLQSAQDGDPWKRLKFLSEQYARHVNTMDSGLSLEDRAELLQLNRAEYHKLRMVQRQQLLHKIRNKLPLVLNQLIASFIMGGVSVRLQTGDRVRCFSCATNYLILKLIKSLSTVWGPCDFTHTINEVACLGEESRIIRWVNLEEDEVMHYAVIPEEMTGIMRLEGSVSGATILMSNDHSLVWKNGRPSIFRREDPDQLLNQLPLYAINLEEDLKKNLYACYRGEARKPHDVGIRKKCIVLAEDRREYSIVMGPMLKKCLLIGKDKVKEYDSRSDTMRTIELKSSKPEHPFYAYSGALSLEGGNLALWGDNLCRLYTFYTYKAPSYGTKYVEEGIRDVRMNGNGTCMVILPEGIRAPTVVHTSQSQYFYSSDIQLLPLIGVVKRMLLKEDRLLLHCQDATSWVIDIPDIIDVTQKFTTTEADLCDALWRTYQLLGGRSKGYNSLLSKKNTAHKIKLNVNQAAAWESIPAKLRKNFSENVKNRMSIHTQKNLCDYCGR